MHKMWKRTDGSVTINEPVKKRAKGEEVFDVCQTNTPLEIVDIAQGSAGQQPPRPADEVDLRRAGK